VKHFLIKLYRYVFCRKAFYSLNQHIYKLTLRGIGILNSDGPGPEGMEHLLKFISDNLTVNVIVDVGANDGGYSELMRSKFPKAKIFALEPHPEAFKKLNSKKGIITFNFGLSDRKGTFYLWDFADKSLRDKHPVAALSSVYKEVFTKLYKKNCRKVRIKLTTLDEFANTERIKEIDLLKIDTEGSEFKVLLGGGKLIRSGDVKIIQFEFNEMNIASRVFFKDFYDLLSDYDLFRLMPYGFLPIKNYDPKIHEIFAFQNIVAFRKDLGLNQLNG
jgi:FkbM family methyltransferase